jgi:aspartate carbamoyltransferase catalytic subunit
MNRSKPLTRHVVSINDLSNSEIEAIFDTAQAYLDRLPDPRFSYRIGKSAADATNFILATLFYEPSTRTRLSFESAMIRLGGQTITSADPATSSAAKGESLADSVRVIANYADVLVIRHPRDGAARLAAAYSPIPVINGGDGSHEHPTQTLCDLFTLTKKNKRLKNLKVAISGDLKGSRTIHSFVYALARFGATIDPLPAKGMELPEHVHRRLREEYNCKLVSKNEPGKSEEPGSLDALYVTSDEPHQQSLFSGPEVDYGLIRHKKIDAVYVTRFQKERWGDQDQEYPKIDLRDERYAAASVMHPLPRVGELDASFDTDTRAVYFQQAAYGVPIRMALIALLLGLRQGKALDKFEGGFAAASRPLYSQPLSVGLRCVNPNCIVHEPMESQYVRNKFEIIATDDSVCRLRCFYCERDANEFVVASRRQQWFTEDRAGLRKADAAHMRDLIIFASAADAEAAGFHHKRDGTAPALRRAR